LLGVCCDRGAAVGSLGAGCVVDESSSVLVMSHRCVWLIRSRGLLRSRLLLLHTMAW
jgi:hypothetical protein